MYIVSSYWEANQILHCLSEQLASEMEIYCLALTGNSNAMCSHLELSVEPLQYIFALKYKYTQDS